MPLPSSSSRRCLSRRESWFPGGPAVGSPDLDGNRYGRVGVATGSNVDKRIRIKEYVKILVTPDGTEIYDYFNVPGECR